jgi:hypothetical protein
MTKTSLVHDMYIERTMRQFSLYQTSLVPVTHTVDLFVHQ